MVPRIDDDEKALKLSLVGCIKDSIVGKEAIIEYLVYVLNKHNNLKYVQLYNLTGNLILY